MAGHTMSEKVFGVIAPAILALALLLAPCDAARAADTVSVRSLLGEMTDLENLARRPAPFYRHAMASSFSRESLKGGDALFDNNDVGQYVRTETNGGRKEQVLADLKGPGTITRFWSANPENTPLLSPGSLKAGLTRKEALV